MSKKQNPKKIKEMKYTKDTITTCLYEEDYKGYKILIINRGTHPCAYVGTNDKKNPFYKIDYDYLQNLDYYGNVHGGFTYSDFGVAGFHKNFWFLGWDYAHAGDFMGYYSEEKIAEYRKNDKKWTTREILKQAKKQIDELLQLKFTEIKVSKKISKKIK